MTHRALRAAVGRNQRLEQLRCLPMDEPPGSLSGPKRDHIPWRLRASRAVNARVSELGPRSCSALQVGIAARMASSQCSTSAITCWSHTATAMGDSSFPPLATGSSSTAPETTTSRLRSIPAVPSRACASTVTGRPREVLISRRELTGRVRARELATSGRLVRSRFRLELVGVKGFEPSTPTSRT